MSNSKDQQAWMYDGFRIQRAPSLFINGTKYIDPKEMPQQELPRRRHESNFFVTINANKAVHSSLNDVASVAWARGLDALKRAITSSGECVVFGPKHPEFSCDVYEDVVIGTPEFKATTEVGPNLGRLHAHVIVKVAHYSEVQLSTPKMQTIFKRAYNGALFDEVEVSSMLRGARIRQLVIAGLPYVDIELLKQSNASQILMRYIFKDNPEACPDI